jgi:tetratricopeptide (TPR) repeat protein
VADELENLTTTLMSGIRLSMQGSYSRRAPAKASVPYFIQARDGLREFVRRNSNSAEAWRLLSQAEECLLNYGQAIACLQKSISLSGKRDKRSLKRLAMLRESLTEWSSLPLGPDELRELGSYLVECGAAEERNGRTLQFTNDWLTEKGLANREEIVERLSKHGGYTDFTILYNVVRS